MRSRSNPRSVSIGFHTFNFTNGVASRILAVVSSSISFSPFPSAVRLLLLLLEDSNGIGRDDDDDDDDDPMAQFSKTCGRSVNMILRSLRSDDRFSP